MVKNSLQIVCVNVIWLVFCLSSATLSLLSCAVYCHHSKREGELTCLELLCFNIILLNSASNISYDSDCCVCGRILSRVEMLCLQFSSHHSAFPWWYIVSGSVQSRAEERIDPRGRGNIWFLTAKILLLIQKHEIWLVGIAFMLLTKPPFAWICVAITFD